MEKLKFGKLKAEMVMAGNRIKGTRTGPRRTYQRRLAREGVPAPSSYSSADGQDRQRATDFNGCKPADFWDDSK